MNRYVPYAGLALLAACIAGPPTIEGVPGAPPSPNQEWVPPRNAVPAQARPAPAPIAASALQHLTIPDIVDLALENNPATRFSWAQARAAADVFGATRGRLLAPTLAATASATRSRNAAIPGRPALERDQFAPGVNLSWLVLDFGGRAGTIDVARQTAVAAGFTHNITVQNTVLQTEAALFGYLGTRALRDAAQASVQEAKANLDAAEERHRVGLATIADVLQARTALSQAQLDLETQEGALHTALGALASSMGLPANTRFDVPTVPSTDSVRQVSLSVDSLIDVAVRERPDLAAARAQTQAAAAQVRVARSAELPSVGLASAAGYTSLTNPTFSGRTYSLGLSLQLPIFSGGSQQYDIAAAQAQLDAANARAETLQQQVVLQVLTAYYGLETASQHVTTAADLLASAQQNEQVALGRYREGVGSIVDLLLAQSALASARAQAVGTRWQWRMALAQLAHDVGVLGVRGEALAPIGTDSLHIER